MKNKRIILHKNQILDDIEMITYKSAKAAALEPKPKSVIAADQHEDLDKRMLNRMIEFRDATLRKVLMFCLCPTTQDVSCDKQDESTDLVYDVSLNDKFNDNKLSIAKTYMHDYIVRGVLLDWYIRLGVSSPVSEAEVSDLENKVVSLLREPSYMRAPLQPFGPAEKML